MNYGEYKAKLVYNNGSWCVVVPGFGSIELEEEVGEDLDNVRDRLKRTKKI